MRLFFSFRENSSQGKARVYSFHPLGQSFIQFFLYNWFQKVYKQILYHYKAKK